MIRQNRETAPLQRPETGVVVDFEAAKARSHDRRLASAESGAIQALADLDAGRASLTDVLATLIAPFNRAPL
jgi:hypothetical protein